MQPSTRALWQQARLTLLIINRNRMISPSVSWPLAHRFCARPFSRFRSTCIHGSAESTFLISPPEDWIIQQLSPYSCSPCIFYLGHSHLWLPPLWIACPHPTCKQSLRPIHLLVHPFGFHCCHCLDYCYNLPTLFLPIISLAAVKVNLKQSQI